MPFLASSYLQDYNECCTPPQQKKKKNTKKTGVHGAFRWHAAGAQPRWDMGNYYTVGGSGRVIPKDPVSVSQIGYGHFYDCAW